MDLDTKYNLAIGATSAVTVAVANFFGDFDVPFQILLVFMVLDYIAGIIVALVFKRSRKTKNGKLSSAASIKGLFKKTGVFIAVIIAHELDVLLKSNFIRDTVILAYIFNEGLSIVENLGLMGVGIPAPLKKGLEMLKEKTGTAYDNYMMTDGERACQKGCEDDCDCEKLEE